MEEKQLSESAVYEIRVKGLLEQRWAQWFDGMKIIPDPSFTTGPG